MARKILAVVEGAKTDVQLLQNLVSLYPEIGDCEIVSYYTNIYVLYGDMFAGKDTDVLNLIDVLLERERDAEKRQLLNEKYTDIILIFDFDPHDGMFTREKIEVMQTYFAESTDEGKLYINYPMIEAFYHLKHIPDNEFMDRIVTKEELERRGYKERVDRETYTNRRRFATDKATCNQVILQNLNKAFHLLDDTKYTGKWKELSLSAVLSKQLDFWDSGYVHVLCTCIFYIYDYDHKLLLSE